VEAPITLEYGKGFCGMLTNQCRSISMILQKTSINVDEQGTVAAAVTASMITTAAPLTDSILFQADHPFQFFVCDSDEDLCFFEGRVGAPGIPPGSLTPLTSLHTEEDFWLNHFGVNVSVEEGVGTPNSTETNSTIDTGSSAAASVSFVAWMPLATLATAAWFCN
jgi:hypothetical protein